MLGEVLTLKKAEEMPETQIWEITTDKGRYQCFEYFCNGSPSENGRLSGEAEFRVHGVAYCATCDGEFSVGKKFL